MTDLGVGSIRCGFANIADNSGAYGNFMGTTKLRETISSLHGVSADEIAITSGASMGLAAALAILPKPGIVLCPRPYYPAYPKLISAFGLKPFYYSADFDTINPDDLPISGDSNLKTVAMLCNSPGNPTGKIISDSVLKRIENWTEQNGILLIRDEAYSGFEYVPNASPPLSALTIPKPNSVLVRSFSKILGIPGERLGYLVADKILIDRISQAHLWLALTPPAYSLELVSGLVACWDATKHQKLLNELLERRNLAAETLSVAPEVSFTLPQGGIFIWMSIKGIASGVEFAKNCFDWEKLIVVAGEEFGGEKQCYARISFAVSRNDLLTGLEALIRVVKKMQIN